MAVFRCFIVILALLVTVSCQKSYECNDLPADGFKWCWIHKTFETRIKISKISKTESPGWIGVGVGTDMVGSNTVFGNFDDGSIKVYSITDTKGLSNWRNGAFNISNAILSVISQESFLEFTINNDHLRENWVYASGDVEGAIVEQHESTSRGKFTHDFVTGETQKVAIKMPVILVLHAIFMGLAWIILLPAGMLMARYGKKTFREGKWFEYHKKLQCTGLGFSLLALLFGLLKGTQTQLFHFAIGIAIMVIGIFQPVLAYWRPPKKKDVPQSTNRRLWEYTHKGCGFFCILFGVINVIVGITIAVEFYDM